MADPANATDRDALAKTLWEVSGSQVTWRKGWGFLAVAARDLWRGDADRFLASDWLARVREQAAREALESAADDLEDIPWLDVDVPEWLRERAGEGA